MYLVNDKKAAKSLVEIARTAANKFNIKSSGMTSEEPKEQSVNFSEMEIKTEIKVEDYRKLT
jgi:hypothetical protein